MLRSLTAGLAGRPALRLTPGVTLLAGDGASGVPELLGFLLGAPAPGRALPRGPHLRDTVLTLELDWPPGDGPLTVRGSGADAGHLYAEPDPRGEAPGGALFGVGEVAGAAPLGREEWAALVGVALFGLPSGAGSEAARGLLPAVLRRGAEPAKAAGAGHALGLDRGLAAEFAELAAAEGAREHLAKAAADPALRRITGDPGALRAEAEAAGAEVERLRAQIAGFRVGPAYEELRERAAALDALLREPPAEDLADRRTVASLERALQEPEDAGTDHLAAVYEEAGLVLGAQVRRTFEEVSAFHRSVSRNRSHHLQAELDAARDRIEERAHARAEAAGELSDVLRALAEGGALDALTARHEALAAHEAKLRFLTHRHEAARALEGGTRQLKADRARLLAAAELDLDERREGALAEAAALFTSYAERLHGSGQVEARVDAEVGAYGPEFTPSLARGGTPVRDGTAAFCWGLALAVLAHRHGRGPDFLVHDAAVTGALGSGLLAPALALVREVTAEERMQYVAVLPTGAVAEARAAGQELGPVTTLDGWATG